MMILAIESSGRACSLAIGQGGQFSQTPSRDLPHPSRYLLEQLDDLLRQNNVALSQIAVIAVSSGPGHFTGIRLGVSAAQGLAFALKIPTVSVNTLQVIAQQAHDTAQHPSILVALDAYQGEVYLGAYQALSGWMTPVFPTTLWKIGTSPPILSGEWVTTGNAWEKHESLFSNFKNSVHISIEPDARMTGILGEKLWKAGETLPPEQLEPFYLRDHTAWKTLC